MRILFIWANQGSFGVKPMGISVLISVLEQAGHICSLFDTSFMDFGGANYNDDLTENGFFKSVEWPCDVSKVKVFLEDEIDKKVNEFQPDVFAISALNDEVDLCLKIDEIVSKYRKVIVWGNKAASLKSIQDYCVSRDMHYYLEGESTNSFLQLLDSGINNIRPQYHKNLNILPILDWTNFDNRHFLRAYDGDIYRSGDHMIGWGCTNSCAYCINESWRELHGGIKGSMRWYDVPRITDELQKLSYMYNLDFWKFHDEDFLLKPLPYFEKLVSEYLDKVDLPFVCMTNAKSVTETKTKLLKEMGCVSVSIGVETGNLIMRQMLNRRETPEDICNAVKILEDYGIRVSAFNMLNLPFETEETIKETIELNVRAGIKNPNVSLFIPLEGTRLHKISVMYDLYKPGTVLSTDVPVLKNRNLSHDTVLYYYKNFYKLITERTHI